MGNRKHLIVDYETFDLVTKDVIKQFLKNNKQFVGMKITHNFIIRKLVENYLEDDSYY